MELKKNARKGLIHLPTLVLLSDSGIQDFLNRNINPKKFVLADGAEKLGIDMKNYNPQTLQKMILHQYVSTLQISIDSVTPIRKDLLDLNKLVVFSMLYEQFDLLAWEVICKSEIVMQWNRTHPKYPIDIKTPGNPRLLKVFLEEHADEVEKFKQFLFLSVKAELSGTSKSTDSMLLEGTIQKFLTNLRPFIWLLLTTPKEPQQSLPVLKDLVGLLKTYVSKTYISEYVGLLVLELASFLCLKPTKKAQKSLLQNTPPNGISILWQFHPKKNIPGERAKVSIVICDQDTAMKELGAKITSRANVEVNKKTLKEFYSSSNAKDGEVYSLGLYYLSFLKDACNEQGISFNAYLTSGIKGNHYINLKFAF
ncbi:MAG: hypothetical protein SNJ78_05450 [Spirochaetales bacterium]